MLSVIGASGDSAKVAEKSSEGMTKSGSGVFSAALGRPAMSPVDCALHTDDTDDAYDAESLKWKAYSNKLYVPSLTWYWYSGATRYVCHTRRAMYDYKPCGGVTVRTAPDYLLLISGITKLRSVIIQEPPTG